MNTQKAEQQTGASVALRVKYTLDDCGCYVDSARGIYAIDKILCFAEDHGLVWEQDKLFANDDPDNLDYSSEAEDHADDYMNANYGVDGAYWGRSDQGDWGLWEVEQD